MKQFIELTCLAKNDSNHSTPVLININTIGYIFKPFNPNADYTVIVTTSSEGPMRIRESYDAIKNLIANAQS